MYLSKSCKKLSATTLLEEYQNSTFTLLSGACIINSALNVAENYDTTAKSLSTFPVSLPISMLGIRIPVPVPSSPIITLVMFSYLLSITTTRLAPARSAFLTFVTKEQPPLSTSTILVANASYAN